MKNATIRFEKNKELVITEKNLIELIDTLSPEDRKTFFRLFLPLLDFTNQTFKISEELDEQLRMGCPDICELKVLADVLWKNTEIIDEYVKALQEKDKLSVEDVDLLKSWRHPVSGRFLLERHHSQGSVFIDTNTSEVYLVKGITDPWSVMLKQNPLPILMQATLIPFCDCIISDGLVAVENVSFGFGSRSDFRECYLNAKQTGRIVTSL